MVFLSNHNSFYSGSRGLGLYLGINKLTIAIRSTLGLAVIFKIFEFKLNSLVAKAAAVSLDSDVEFDLTPLGSLYRYTLDKDRINMLVEAVRIAESILVRPRDTKVWMKAREDGGSGVESKNVDMRKRARDIIIRVIRIENAGSRRHRVHGNEGGRFRKRPIGVL